MISSFGVGSAAAKPPEAIANERARIKVLNDFMMCELMFECANILIVRSKEVRCENRLDENGEKKRGPIWELTEWELGEESWGSILNYSLDNSFFYLHWVLCIFLMTFRSNIGAALGPFEPTWADVSCAVIVAVKAKGRSLRNVTDELFTIETYRSCRGQCPQNWDGIVACAQSPCAASSSIDPAICRSYTSSIDLIRYRTSSLEQHRLHSTPQYSRHSLIWYEESYWRVETNINTRQNFNVDFLMTTVRAWLN